MHKRYGIIFVFLLLFWGIGFLHATQAFWSLDPSTRDIERADSLTGFDITKYTIDLVINEQSHFISGSVEAEVLAEASLSEISYELTGGTLTVLEVKVNGLNNTFTHQNGVIHIPLAIASGESFTTKVTYSGTPGNSPAPYNIGMLFTTSSVYTLSNPDAGRYWWPSYDHPWDKALVDWNITVRSDWLVASNGIRTSITDNQNGTRTHHWTCSSPVATYVMGFAAAAYTEFTQQAGAIPIQNFVLPSQLNNATIDFANVPEMISYFSQTFGAYPFEKYGHMVVNMSTYAAMEHQTMTTFGSQYLNGQQTYESIVAHELAHQWYGNYVTPLTMSEVWLKESFATYSEALWVHHHEGWEAACEYIRSEIQQYYINWENSNGAHTIFNPEYNMMFAPPTYEKSASVLHMLRLKIGNENFFTFIRALIENFHDSNIVTTEFIALGEEISGQDLSQFFEQWIYSPGIPSVETVCFTKSNPLQLKVFAKSSSPTTTLFELDLPVRLTTSTSIDSVMVKATAEGFVNNIPIPGNSNIENIEIDPNNWVLLRGKTNQIPIMTQCLPSNQAVVLSWQEFNFCNSYLVYRRIGSNGQWLQISTPIQGTGYTDSNVTEGTQYQYAIKGIDPEGYESMLSNVMSATPVSFAFAQNLLVIDETNDGSGIGINPSDQMVDDFYSDALTGYNYDTWDYASQGALDINTLGNYHVVLWHDDDFSQHMITNNLSLLGGYIMGGGKLIISGWKTAYSLDTAFFSRFASGIELLYDNAAALNFAQSNTYPPLLLNPDKLSSSWNGKLPMIFTFTGATTPLYVANMTEGSNGNGQTLAFRQDNGGSLVLFGFPLYCMQTNDVHALFSQLLPELNPLLPIEDETFPAISITAFPNPFTTNIAIRVKQNSIAGSTVSIYNVRGQLVRKLRSEGKSGQDIIWDGKDEEHHNTASGIYFIRMFDTNKAVTKKILKW